LCHLDVVGDTLVHEVSLGAGEPDPPIATGDFACRCDVGVAADPHPEHCQAGQGFTNSLLGCRTPEEDVVVDDPHASVGHRRDPLHPDVHDLVELPADGDGARGAKCDAGLGAHERGRQCVQEIVDAERQPRLREDRLEAARDPGLSGARAAVQHDHLGVLGVCHDGRSRHGVLPARSVAS
jgi:hypothetical protein